MLTTGVTVKWTSSNTRKEGVVVAVVPAGKTPRALGFDVDGAGSPRKHESYLVKGNVPGQPWKKIYWPVASLLERMEGLSADEIKWCCNHPEKIRALMLADSAS